MRSFLDKLEGPLSFLDGISLILMFVLCVPFVVMSFFEGRLQEGVPGLVYTLVQRCFASAVLLMVLVKIYRAMARKHGAGFACCLLALLTAIFCTVNFFLFRNPVRDIAGGLATESTELEYVQFDTDSGEYSVFYKIEGKDRDGNLQIFSINEKTLERYKAANQRYGTAVFRVQYYAHTEIVTGLEQIK